MLRIHLLEAVNSKKPLRNGIIIAYSVPQGPLVKGVEQDRVFKYLRINNNYLFLSWAKKNVGRSEDDVEEELIGYLSRKELTMIGLEEDYEYEKSLGYEAAWNSFYKAFSRICSDKRLILFGAFAATIALAEFLSPKTTSELPLAIVVNPSVGRG